MRMALLVNKVTILAYKSSSWGKSTAWEPTETVAVFNSNIDDGVTGKESHIQVEIIRSEIKSSRNGNSTEKEVLNAALSYMQ